MWKILVTGKRSFIVAKEDVIKGGIQRSYPAGKTIRHEVELAPGRYPYHITNECGKVLESFPDINVIEMDGVEVIEETINEKSSEERIAELEALVKELKSAKKKVKKTAEIKK